MKARSLVLIMLCCIASLTGFGNTTADLTENPNLETLMDSPEVSISVVSVATPEVAIVDVHVDTPVALSADLISNSTKVLTDQYRPELHELAVPPDQLSTITSSTATTFSSHSLEISPVARSENSDVGWRFSAADRLRFLCFS